MQRSGEVRMSRDRAKARFDRAYHHARAVARRLLRPDSGATDNERAIAMRRLRS